MKINARILFLTVIICSSLFILSCSSVRQLEPIGTPEAIPPEAPNSSITFPVIINYADIHSVIDSMLVRKPPQGIYWITGHDLGHGFALQFGVNRNQPSIVTVDGDEIKIITSLELNNGRIDWKTGFLREHLDFGGAVKIVNKIKFFIKIVNVRWMLFIEPSFEWINQPGQIFTCHLVQTLQFL